MRKRWKAGMVTLLSASLFTFGSTAFAAGTGNDQPAAINTPDHFFYFLNRWQEDVDMWFTFNPAQKSELFTKYAQERLAEAKKMIQEKKTSYTKSLMTSYLNDIKRAQNCADQAMTDPKTSEQTKEQLMKKLDQATEVDQTVQNQMDSQETNQLANQKQDIIINASVVKNLDPQTVKTLRTQGLGYGEIVKVAALAKATGKDPSAIAKMLKDQHKGFGVLYKALGVTPQEIAQKILDSKMTALQNNLKQAKSAGNQKTVDQITAKLNHLTAKKLRFDALSKLRDLHQQAEQIKQKVSSGDLSKADAKKQLDTLKQQAKLQFDHLKQIPLDQLGKQDNQDQTKADDQQGKQDQTKADDQQGKQDQQKADDQQGSNQSKEIENESNQNDQQKSEDGQKPNEQPAKGLKVASQHKQNPNEHADKGQQTASEHKSDHSSQQKSEDQKNSWQKNQKTEKSSSSKGEQDHNEKRVNQTKHNQTGDQGQQQDHNQQDQNQQDQNQHNGNDQHHGGHHRQNND